MFHRKQFEVEYASIFDTYKFGSTIWSPLAGGLLTGRYLDSKGDRMDKLNDTVKNMLHFDEYFGPTKIEGTRKLFAGLEEVAKELGA